MANSLKFKKEKCRVHCHTCGHVGKWQSQDEAAKQDARDHLAEYPTHDVDLEYTQSFIVRFSEEA